jgi:bacteriocin-like protein
MQVLTTKDMQEIQGGDAIGAFCVGFALGSGVGAIIFHATLPTATVVVDIACALYGGYQLIED